MISRAWSRRSPAIISEPEPDSLRPLWEATFHGPADRFRRESYNPARATDCSPRDSYNSKQLELHQCLADNSSQFRVPGSSGVHFVRAELGSILTAIWKKKWRVAIHNSDVLFGGRNLGEFLI